MRRTKISVSWRGEKPGRRAACTSSADWTVLEDSLAEVCERWRQPAYFAAKSGEKENRQNEKLSWR